MTLIVQRVMDCIWSWHATSAIGGV